MGKKSFFDFVNKIKKKDASASQKESSQKIDKLLGTISRYFTTEPERERVLRYEDFDAAGDTYYATVSARYKVCQRIFMALFIIFVTISITFNIKNITYDNFFYLVKDFGAVASSDDYRYETLSYDASTNQSFSIYRGGLAVVSRSNVSAFTSTGRRTLRSNAVYSNPSVAASDKYLLVYDMGDSNFAIYNSFAKVYSEKLDYPITDACFSEKGSFILLTRSEKYQSTILFYDEDFDRVSRYSKPLYAIDIAIDENGKRAAAVYLDTENGISATKVIVYDLSSHEEIAEHTFSGEFPLSCAFFESGELSVITDSSVITFDKRAKKWVASESYYSKTVSAIWNDEKHSAVAYNNGVATDINEISVFDKNGNLVYNETIPMGVEQLSVRSGYVFVKNSEGVTRIKMKDSSLQSLECQSGRMLVYDSDTVLVCMQSKAVYLDFSDQ